ncbi:hypothetical protein DID88_001009 [Monilinia fructigena]|uniref:DUF7598 domain-containing protein n=1 Tax=Monilinia fructigena TaxID=38457 RepID=A0A395IYW5_9HELO|nr:hypothetical protein DID88_001009 [Monilinia fructigena]
MNIKQAGRGFLVLNVIRVFNIIALLDVVAASWIMLIMTVKTSNFFFFDGVSHFIASTIRLPMWRVVISSGCLSAIMGGFNIIASLIFSTKDKTARQIRANGATTVTNPYEKRLSLPSSINNQDLPSYYSTPTTAANHDSPSAFLSATPRSPSSSSQIPDPITPISKSVKPTIPEPIGRPPSFQASRGHPPPCTRRI